MKKRSGRLTYPMAPRQQHNWDWRAATNFILGGAGGGLLLCTPLAGFEALTTRIAILLGLALVGTGLTSVWFEIGRPWRALNVFLHFSRSWMTREAVAGLLLFISGALALVTLQPALVVLSGLIGLSFLSCQARMLAVNKGIPTWRHPASIPLMTATGLAEGAGLLVCVLAFSSLATESLVLGVLIALLAARALFWRRYLAGLIADGAPDDALNVLRGFGPRFLLLGHLLPILAAVAALTGIPGGPALMLVAGIMATAGGWQLKFTLMLRAAFTQGLALPRLPVRGQGTGGPAVKPGWHAAPRPIAGQQEIAG
mgnify:CR=1 FL=1